mgnify:CR=1 FL=1
MSAAIDWQAEASRLTFRAQAFIDGKYADAISGKTFDVFVQEPLAKDSPLWRLPNVLISPHNAGASNGTYARGVEIFLRNLGAYLHGKPLENEAAAA